MNEKWPKPVAPLSPAIIANGFVFVSGTVGREPLTNKLPEGIEAQTRQTLENIKVILEEAGSSLDRVVRVGVYLRDVDDWSAMNEIYRLFFPNNPPARSTIQAPVHGEYKIEIDCIALLDRNQGQGFGG